MKYVCLGNTGLKVSRLAFGCMTIGSSKWEEWVKDSEEGKKLLSEAWNQEINFFGTADVYSNGDSERVLGEWIKEKGIGREQIVIATKVFFPLDKSGKNINTLLNQRQTNSLKDPAPDSLNACGLSRKYIMHAVEDSIKRLQVEYIDLYIVHRWDVHTPVEETMEALHDLVKCGKIRYIGASSMWTWQFAKAQRIAKERGWTPFVSMQNHYHLLFREEERDMIPFCKDMGVAITPYSPLGRGHLAHIEERCQSTVRDQTDRRLQIFKSNFSESDTVIRQRVLEISKKKGCSTAQLAISWLLHKDGVTSPIIGATKVEQIKDLCGALSIELTQEEIKYLEEPYKAKDVYVNIQYPSNEGTK